MSAAAPATYVSAIKVTDLFADPTYQRDLDVNRAKSMSVRWDPRLVGVIDVSDRGDDTPPNSPRYAIINGQHRWKAALFLDPELSLVCNVHTGLSISEEAKLFKDIDERTKKISTWDRWRARRAAGDPVVLEIDRIADALGLVVTQNPGPVNIQCCAALEHIHDRFMPETLREVLELVCDVWPGDVKRFNPAILKGLGRTLFVYAGELDTGRFADCLSEITPSQLYARAHELKATGHAQGIPHLVTVAAVVAYNRTGRDKLTVPAA
ncbi:ParB-like nuclease domain protein [Gordonia phage Doggs]|nr:ParB-like nuclease domain protein [Gordonia phage Doggs]